MEEQFAGGGFQGRYDVYVNVNHSKASKWSAIQLSRRACCWSSTRASAS